jgi:hypothetical protein
MDDDQWTFNGIDASTGAYLLQASPAELTRVARGIGIDPKVLGELKHRHKHASESHFGVKAGIDVCDLSQTGWGVIFPAVRTDSPEAHKQAAIREALSPLLAHRKALAASDDARCYREYSGTAGLRPDENKQQFLARHGMGPGPADPVKVPYYLLLVGDPTELPFRFQSQLSVQYAVGRIAFATLDEYAHYARSVVTAETQALALARRLTFFSVANSDDPATQSSASALVTPLANLLMADAQLAGWRIDEIAREAATRSALSQLLAGGDAPALLFTASHGMGFTKDHALQVRHQGALLCQDWPGPKQWAKQPIPESHYFAGDHLPADANLLGTIAFLFACYGAGTPEHDEFAAQAFKKREQIAARPFIAGLPNAMLTRPRGGALAVIGHVERAWGCSFMWAGSGGKGKPGAQLAVFESALKTLMTGMPVGAAMEYFDERYAELSTDLSVELEQAKWKAEGEEIDEYRIADLWTANNDARGYAILGDPAVRVMAPDGPQKPRTAIDRGITLATAAAPTPAPAPARESAAAAAPTGPIVSFSAPMIEPASAPPPAPRSAPPTLTLPTRTPPTVGPPAPAPTVSSPAAPAAVAAPAAAASPAPAVTATPTQLSTPLDTALQTLEITTRGPGLAALRTRIDRHGIDGVLEGEPGPALREHHEALVRAAVDRQVRVLTALLRHGK